MPADSWPGELRSVAEQITRPREWADSDIVPASMSIADSCTLLAVLTAWVGIVLMLAGDLHAGILVVFGAFGFDTLDDHIAHWTGTSRSFGRLMATLIDTSAYAIPSLLVLHYGVAPNDMVSLSVSSLMLGFGGYRLVRIGGVRPGSGLDGPGAPGMTWVHMSILIVANFVAIETVPLWQEWHATVTVALASPLMISKGWSHDTTGIRFLGGVLVYVLAGLVAILGYAN